MQSLMRPVAVVAVLILTGSRSDADELKYLPVDLSTGGSTAVVVGDVPLVHTTQFVAGDDSGNAASQAERVLGLVAGAIRAGGGDPARVVKLNVGVANAEVVEPVRKAIEKQYPEGKRPAVSFVVGKLSKPNALVAIDAVAPVAGTVDGVKVVRDQKGLPASVAANSAVLPAGRRVYISGQAEKGDTPAEATRKTLASLRATLKWLGLSDSHVVQCKSFLTPMSAAGAVTKEFAAHFGEGKVPPLVFVEWDSALPIEIELIAAAPSIGAEPVPPVEFLTPPGMKESPVYSRLTRVKSSRFIYTGGLVSAGPGNGEAQVTSTFERLRESLKGVGGDFNHLVKATYYVSDEDASGALNKLRPRYYDPRRPPAASKAKVAGTGFQGRTLILDMIAVPAGR